MGQRSTVEQLPPQVLAEVHAAIKRGQTIDQIVGRIRELGGGVSRSAVGRYTKEFAELAKEQRNMRAVAEAFGQEFGDADDRQGRMMVQLLTSVITRAIMPMASGDDAHVDLDGKEMHFLARAVKDTMSAAKIDVEREARIRDEEAKRARTKAADDAVTIGRAAGASEATLNMIRAGLLGIAS